MTNNFKFTPCQVIGVIKGGKIGVWQYMFQM